MRASNTVGATNFGKVLRSSGAVLCLCLAGLAGEAVAADKNLRVVQGSHPLDEYAVGALKLALAELDEGYTVEVRKEQITQTRGIEELREGRQDVMWLATNREVEEQLLPVRFPLLKGLLGYRVNIINPASQSRFNRVDSVSDLQGLSFGQGMGWPDVEILRNNNLKVITTSKYENLFLMVEGGRFDGFPRGVIEPWVEIEAHRDLGLVVEDKLVLVYTLPFYLFVDPSNAELAEAIHQGFELALKNGSFDRYFFDHPMVKSTLEKAKLQQRKAFQLNNPGVPSKTPLERQDYWLDVTDL